MYNSDGLQHKMHNTVQAYVICRKHFDKYSKKARREREGKGEKSNTERPTKSIGCSTNERIWIASMCREVNLYFESCRLQITYNLNRLLASFRYYLFVW